jgi:hypothetical protein
MEEPDTNPADDEQDQTGETEQTAKPEDFEDDPARNPDDEALKNIKGG